MEDNANDQPSVRQAPAPTAACGKLGIDLERRKIAVVVTGGDIDVAAQLVNFLEKPDNKIAAHTWLRFSPTAIDSDPDAPNGEAELCGTWIGERDTTNRVVRISIIEVGWLSDAFINGKEPEGPTAMILRPTAEQAMAVIQNCAMCTVFSKLGVISIDEVEFNGVQKSVEQVLRRVYLRPQ